MAEPHKYQKGDKVIDIHTGEHYTVKCSYWQYYTGGNTSDFTVEFEPTDAQKTPWNKSRNLRAAE